MYIVDNLRINYEFLSMFIQDSTLTFDDVQEIMQVSAPIVSHGY